MLHVEQEVVGDDTTALESVLQCDTVREELLRKEHEISVSINHGYVFARIKYLNSVRRHLCLCVYVCVCELFLFYADICNIQLLCFSVSCVSCCLVCLIVISRL